MPPVNKIKRKEYNHWYWTKYYQKHRDDILAKNRTYNKTEKCKEQARFYYQQNREKLLERSKSYYQEHRAEILARYHRNYLKRKLSVGRL